MIKKISPSCLLWWLLCCCFYCCDPCLGYRWDYVKIPDFQGTEYIFRYPIKDAEIKFDDSQPYVNFASDCFALTENGHKIFAPLNDTRALDAFTKLFAENASLGAIVNDKELCTNWTYKPYANAVVGPVPLAWNIFGPSFTPPPGQWDRAAVDNHANLIALLRMGSVFKYSAVKTNEPMYHLCEYFPLPNSSANIWIQCSAASPVASLDGGPPVNQSYCVHSQKRKPDDDYRGDFNGYGLFCEKGGGRPAQAESAEKQTKLWKFVNESVLPGVVVNNGDYLMLALMIDTGMTNWRRQSLCLPGTPCRSNINKDILGQDRTRGLVVRYKWKDSLPKDVKKVDYNQNNAVLCTAMTCPNPHTDDQLIEKNLVCTSWNSSLTTQELQLKKLPFQHIEYRCVPNFVFLEAEANISIVRRCTQDAVWDREIPTCVSLPCSQLPAYPNDTALISSFTTKGVTYGSASIELLTQLLANGTFRPGDQLHIECQPGLTGSRQTATCLPGGSWSRVSPDCSPGYCGGVSVPPKVANASLNQTLGNSSWEGVSLMFTCDANYSIGGQPNGAVSFVISCINSSWTYFANLSCLPTACSTLPAELGNSNLYSSLDPEKELSGLPETGLKVDDSLSYECRPGFVRATQNRRLSIACRLGNRWEPEVPGPCQLLNCSQPEAISLQPHAARMSVVNSSFSLDNSSSQLPYTSLVRLSCQEPHFAMPGSSELAVCGLSDGDPTVAVWRGVGSSVAFSCRKHCNNSQLAQLVGFGHASFSSSPYTDPDRIANVTCLPSAFAPLAGNISQQYGLNVTMLAACTGGDWSVFKQLLLPTSETLCQPKPCLLPTNLTRSIAVPSSNLVNVTMEDGLIYLPVGSTINITCEFNNRFLDSYENFRTAICEFGPHWRANGSMHCKPVTCPANDFGPSINLSVLAGPLNATNLAESLTAPFLVGDQVAFVCRANSSSSGHALLDCTAGPNLAAWWKLNTNPPSCLGKICMRPTQCISQATLGR